MSFSKHVEITDHFKELEMGELLLAAVATFIMFGVPTFILILGELVTIKRYDEQIAAYKEEQRRLEGKLRVIQEERQRAEGKAERIRRGEYEDKE